jgi:hypothetical protein
MGRRSGGAGAATAGALASAVAAGAEAAGAETARPGSTRRESVGGQTGILAPRQAKKNYLL